MPFLNPSLSRSLFSVALNQTHKPFRYLRTKGSLTRDALFVLWFKANRWSNKTEQITLLEGRRREVVLTGHDTVAKMPCVLLVSQWDQRSDRWWTGFNFLFALREWGGWLKNKGCFYFLREASRLQKSFLEFRSLIPHLIRVERVSTWCYFHCPG